MAESHFAKCGRIAAWPGFYCLLVLGRGKTMGAESRVKRDSSSAYERENGARRRACGEN